MSTPIPQLDFSLTNISGLPDDLRAAHNSAVWLASEAQTICKTVLGGQISIFPNASNLVALVVNNIRRERNGCKAAIDAVILELAKVRKRRIRFGSIVAATAHEAAIELSQNVVQAVWFGCTFMVDEKDERAMKNHQKAFDIWQRVHSDPSARYDSDCIIENYEGVVRYFASQKTEWPNADEIIAEVKLESAKAAARRVKPASGTKTTRRRPRRANSETRPLTPTQTKIVELVSIANGDTQKVADELKITRQAVAKSYRAGMKKLGQKALPKPKKKSIPMDERGQDTLSEPDPRMKIKTKK